MWISRNWTAFVLGSCVTLATGCQSMPMSAVSAQIKDGMIRSQLALARSCEMHGDSAQATHLYDLVLKRDRSQPEPYHRLGNIAARQGDFAKADELYHKALELNSDNVELLNDYGYACYLQNNVGEAEVAFRKALVQDPDHQQTRNNLGLVFGTQGRMAEAIQNFNRSGTLAEAYANVGFVHTQRKEYEFAEQYYKLAVAMDPSLQSASRALADVAKRLPASTEPGASKSDNAIEPASSDLNSNHAIEPASGNDQSSRRDAVSPAIHEDAPGDSENDGEAVLLLGAEVSYSPASLAAHSRDHDVTPAELPAITISSEMDANALRVTHLENWVGANLVARTDLADATACESSAVTDALESSDADRAAVLALIDALKDRDAHVRAAAALALGKLCHHRNESAQTAVIPAVVEDGSPCETAPCALSTVETTACESVDASGDSITDAACQSTPAPVVACAAACLSDCQLESLRCDVEPTSTETAPNTKLSGRSLTWMNTLLAALTLAIVVIRRGYAAFTSK